MTTLTVKKYERERKVTAMKSREIKHASSALICSALLCSTETPFTITCSPLPCGFQELSCAYLARLQGSSFPHFLFPICHISVPTFSLQIGGNENSDPNH